MGGVTWGWRGGWGFRQVGVAQNNFPSKYPTITIAMAISTLVGSLVGFNLSSLFDVRPASADIFPLLIVAVPDAACRDLISSSC